ncbi:MAG TPA: hybrid sensor histidine kinase/response regulator, partial [Cytophagales bacterium]|nr:hybrid sensor histidine kinase/response regulator [Cytophagales bacterium]
ENEELLKVQAQNKKITITNLNRMNLPVNLHRNSINTVVRNLIANAIKFTPEGGEIRLNADVKDNEYIISVTDTGVGMSEEAIKKLFKIGTKYSTLGTAKEKGTGLGLILCKDFIEKNGGEIQVTSEINKGSSFSFSLPAVK